MDNVFFEREVENALAALRNGGLILYPTDTVWGIGCDATNEEAVGKIFRLKQRDYSKSLIILVADERSVLQYVAAPDLAVFDFLQKQERPTTIIFDGAIGLASGVTAGDGSVAVRITGDLFCRHLIKRFRKPIVSTSANISSEPAPALFSQVSDAVKAGVDYVVQWRQEDEAAMPPSQIIRWHGDGTHTVIRS